jgi:hypothetical protein
MRKPHTCRSISLELPNRAVARALAERWAKATKARVVVRDDDGDEIAILEPKMDS